MDERVIDLQKEENAMTSATSGCTAAPGGTGRQAADHPPADSLQAEHGPRRAPGCLRGRGSYFDAHRAEFDDLYDRLVKNRTEQAHILGYKDYSELSYVRMNRIGYGAKEVAAFRKEVEEQVVPMLRRMLDLRAKRTGIEHPMFWDSGVCFADGNPVPHGTYEELMAGARRMYHELSLLRPNSSTSCRTTRCSTS